MPPLALTGERTLPDVPEENYWFRRHLAVYEWIAERVARRCGSPISPAARATAPTCSPARAAEVVGVDANPEAHEHARLRYTALEPALRARPGRVLRRAVRRDRLPADDRARRTSPARCSTASPAPRAVSYVSTPNRLTLAPEGAEKSDNPWHLREYTAAEYRELLEPRFSRGRDLRRLSRPQAARCTSSRSRAGWDRVHPALRITKPLLRPLRARRSPPPTSRSARRATATSTGRSTSSPSAAREPTAPGGGPGDRPPQPHALRRGLRHLPVRRGVAVRRGDPLLRPGLRDRRPADDDGHPGARRPARGRRRRRAAARVPAASSGSVRARPTSRDVEPPLRAACRGGGRALPRGARPARALDGDLLRAVRRARRRGTGRAARLGRDPRRAAAARDRARAGGCRSTPGCARTGAASASRAGFWLPECAYEPGLERLLAERGRRATSAPTRARTSQPLAALAPVAAGRARSAFTIDWEAVAVAVVARRLPVRPGCTPTSTASRCAARGPWSIGGERLRPGGRRAARAREQGARVRRRGGGPPRAVRGRARHAAG